MFLLRGEELAALAAAVGAHELGHVLMLCVLGARIDRVVLAATGPVLRCELPRTGATGILAALSGPIAGAVLWALLRRTWTLAAEMSLVLTLVNLLPVLPLDGGRALAAALGRHSGVLRVVRVSVLAALAAFGGFCAATGRGCAPLLLTFWLLTAPESRPRDTL